MRAYFHDNKTDTPFTYPHIDTSKPSLTESQLSQLGVTYRYLPNLDDVNKLSDERNYKNRDIIELSPKTFPGGPEAFAQKLEVFYEEHLHEDEEIRYILQGSGYFDVRDQNENWVRLFLTVGDLIILPAGIYHRFTMCEMPEEHLSDDGNEGKLYVKALRLFKDEPKWLALNRKELVAEGQESNIPSRSEYLESIKSN